MWWSHSYPKDHAINSENLGQKGQETIVDSIRSYDQKHQHSHMNISPANKSVPRALVNSTCARLKIQIQQIWREGSKYVYYTKCWPKWQMGLNLVNSSLAHRSQCHVLWFWM